MREVPHRPSAEEMQRYRINAAVMLRAAIFSAIRNQDSTEIDTYATAANAIGDYALARSRWVKYYEEDYL